MTTTEKVLIPIVITAMIFCFFKACDNIKIVEVPTQRDSVIYKIDTLKEVQVNQVVKWRTSQSKTYTIHDSILVTSPDTCTPFLRKQYEAFIIERKNANLVHLSDSMIIDDQDKVISLDSLIHAKLVAQNDSLKKPRPLRKLRTRLKHLAQDVALVGASVGVIYVIEKVK